MNRTVIFLFAAFLCRPALYAQNKVAFTYYLPDLNYSAAIPTPEQYLGYQVGEWHVSHDRLLGYMQTLDAASDRISLREYGRSHEGRPLICLTITDPSNHARLNAIRETRARLIDAEQSDRLNIAELPAVNYMGYSIHGNEPSGSNASLLTAYYLAAAPEEEVGQLLKNTIILLDPSFNPDGLNRFASWVNSRHNKSLVTDPADDEYNEPWPRGRTNHYWFDLNRDWLVAQQPESVGRVALFQEWRPNVLTDHHEMGSNSTFFFQPGVPARVNPITPARNQELTAKIATFHAEKLSKHNVLFYSGENYDDFYYGKGSTYPDVQGSVGILFEQGSSRGSAQDTENGLLTFPFSIRNQVFSSLSTLKAVGEMRVELNEYLRDFYKDARRDAQNDEIKGYVINAAGLDLPARAFMENLRRHSIDVKNLKADVVASGKKFIAGNAFYVSCDQAQYRLIKAIFARQIRFQDSIFYDISAWTLPDAYGLEWSPARAGEVSAKALGESVSLPFAKQNPPTRLEEAYAYILDAKGYELPKVLARLLKEGIRVKVASEAFTVSGRRFEAGSIVIASERQPVNEMALRDRMNTVSEILPVFPVTNGQTLEGPDLGSESFRTLRAPKVMMLTGEGVNPADAGEVWHLLDTRYGIPVTHVDVNRFNGGNWNKYNVLVIADGAYGTLSSEKVTEFAQNGGTVIATGTALRKLKTANLVAAEFREPVPAENTARPYAKLEDDRGALRLPGAIFEAELDLSHPLCYGYDRAKIPVFLGDDLFLAPAKNPYATPVRFTKDPLLAGYVNGRQKDLLPDAAAAIVYGLGRGRVIGFSINPNFRSFWYGTNRLFANAIFFGNLIAAEALEKRQ